MAIVKVITVKNLASHVAYCLQEKKVGDRPLVTCNDCTPMTICNEFKESFYEHKIKVNREAKVHARSIIQSFAPHETDAETAHQIGVKLAEEYLGKGHQYMVCTHQDCDHLHNHIVFSTVDRNKKTLYDSKTKNVVHELRSVSDKLCLEYDLSIVERTKTKGISQREHRARKKGISFKYKLEKRIDLAINKASTWDEFIRDLEVDTSIKYGKYIAIKQEGQQRYTRLKRLGINYSENSIRYRISNKESLPEIRPNRVLFDKSSDYFQGADKVALRRWATKKNIEVLASMLHEEMSESKGTKQVEELDANLNQLQKEIDTLDDKLTESQSKLSSLSLVERLRQNQRILELQKQRDQYYQEYIEVEKKKKMQDVEKKNRKILEQEKLKRKSVFDR